MLQNPALKAEFFTSIDSALIFQKERFLDFLKLRILDSSYTKFANKIGLSINSDLLKNALLKGQAKIALNFPYKDCVLKGAQSKDSDKSDEIFFNEILASDEIDVLFKPKALQNFKLISNGQETNDFESIKSALQNRRSIFDEKSGLCSHEQGNKTKASIDEASGKLHDLSQKDKPSTPNLLIKGNNLLALHTLKSRRDIYGQVKLIYIDPPYNTGNDSFNYNDRFNHSAWLVFMKNRLEVAREFLREDGVIFIQCDDNEQAYLKVLCDEIFGRENFVNCIVWKRRGGSANPKNRLNVVIDYILWYSKSENYQVNHIYSLDDENTQQYIRERFTNTDENGRKFMKSPLQSPNYRENLIYDYKGYKTPTKGYSVSREIMEKWDKEGKLCFPKDKNQNINRKIYLDEYKGQPISCLWSDIKVINPMAKERGEFDGQKPEALLKRIIEISTKEGDLVMDFFAGSGTTCAVAHKMNRRWIGIEQMDYVEGITKERLIKVINGEQGGISKAVGWNPLSPSLAEGDKGGGFSSQANATSCHSQGSEATEKSTNHNDNLDSSLRATHSAQNDKQRADSTHAKVPSATFLQFGEGELPKNESLLDCHTERSEVSQDSRDFSHSTNAQNDKNGDILAFSKPKNDKNVKPLELPKNAFIYCELMPLNALYKDKITKSSSEGELARIYDELQTKAFIDYRVDIKEMLKDRDFEALPLADKKQILYVILDSNMDYVAYSDIQDSNFCVDKEVQELNRAFYKGGENG